MKKELIDVAPLSEPVSPWGYMEQVLRQALPQVKDPAQRQDLIEKIRWLRHVAGEINTGHNNPVILLAVGSLTIDGPTRRWMRDVIDAVERVTRAASGEPEPEPDPVELDIEGELVVPAGARG